MIGHILSSPQEVNAGLNAGALAASNLDYSYAKSSDMQLLQASMRSGGDLGFTRPIALASTYGLRQFSIVRITHVVFRGHRQEPAPPLGEDAAHHPGFGRGGDRDDHVVEHCLGVRGCGP